MPSKTLPCSCHLLGLPLHRVVLSLGTEIVPTAAAGGTKPRFLSGPQQRAMTEAEQREFISQAQPLAWLHACCGREGSRMRTVVAFVLLDRKNRQR